MLAGVERFMFKMSKWVDMSEIWLASALASSHAVALDGMVSRGRMVGEVSLR